MCRLARGPAPGFQSRSRGSSTGANAAISAEVFGDSQTCTSSIPALENARNAVAISSGVPCNGSSPGV
jgi:hypothetical protein